MRDQMMATEARQCDCGQPYGHRHGCAIFKCSVCGEQCTVAPQDGPAFCEQHCPEHDYQYEPGEGPRCVICFAEPPADYYED